MKLIRWRSSDAEVLDHNQQFAAWSNGASILLGLVGVALAGWSLRESALPPPYLLAKDILILAALYISALYFFVRYRRATSEVERQRKSYEAQLETIRRLLGRQTEVYHNLMSRTRDSIYKGFDESIYRHRFSYQNPFLTDTLTSSMDSVLTSVRRILESHFRSRDIPESVGLSLSVKARVTGEMVLELCTLPEGAYVEPRSEDYIITLDRDHDTKQNAPGREVRRKVYTIDGNTEFSRIFRRQRDEFHNNDLRALAADDDYLNQNSDWDQYYNATQAVPIWYHHGDKVEIFGFLTVDSLNIERAALFDKEITRSIMMFGADLLALLFLVLEVNDRLSQQNGARAAS